MKPSNPAHSAEFQMPGNPEDGGQGGAVRGDIAGTQSCQGEPGYFSLLCWAGLLEPLTEKVSSTAYCVYT